MDFKKKNNKGQLYITIIGVCIGLLFSLYFLLNQQSSSQDNHFLGGLVILFEFIIRIIIAIFLLVFPVALLNLIYALFKNRKNKNFDSEDSI